MSWYTKAQSNSLIDNVLVPAYTGDSLVVLIGNRRYKYEGVPGAFFENQIRQWKTWANKKAAGEKMSALIRNLAKHLVQQ